MRIGLGSVAVCCLALLPVPAMAAPVQSDRVQPDRTPSYVNDRDGSILPTRTVDPDFVFNPDGDDRNAADSDRDLDGDVAIYQGQDDDVPA